VAADIGRGTLTRLTFEGYSRDPVWTPDGTAVIFGSKRGASEFGLYRQNVGGQAEAELVWASPIPIWPDPQSWSHDGRTLVFSTKAKDTAEDIWTLSLEGDRAAKPWLQTSANEWAGRLSPDGRWMAYNSDESGQAEVYVQPFPGPGQVARFPGRRRIQRHLVARRAPALLPARGPDPGDGRRHGIGLRPGHTEGPLSGRYLATGRDFDVSPDGTRFVMMRNDDPRSTTTLHVVLNWWHALDARANSR